MVQRKFICEQDCLSYLDVDENVTLLDITIHDDNIEQSISVQLTIDDAIELIDEINKVILKIKKNIG